MRLGLSVPKMNAEGGADGGDGPICSSRDGAERFLARTAGKALLLADGASFSALLPAAHLARTVSCLFDGDAAALFALPEVGCVLAAGGADTMRAARLFATLRRIPCALFPASSALDGVYERRFPAGGELGGIALTRGDVCCDLACISDFAEGYSRLVLARLALFEAKAKGLMCRTPFGGRGYEEAFALTEGAADLSPRDIVLRNARLRELEAEGVPVGEGAVLMQSFRAAPLPALRAERALSALYYAFFLRGVPRRYRVADYRARAARAKVPYAALRIPAEAEYAARALALERVRGELLTELVHLRSFHAAQLRTVRALGAEGAPVPDLSALRTLPERAADGLCAVIRDFGLMEEL